MSIFNTDGEGFLANLWDVAEVVVGISNPLAGVAMTVIGDVIFESDAEENTVEEVLPNLLSKFDAEDTDSIDALRTVINALPDEVNEVKDIPDFIKSHGSEAISILKSADRLLK
ncbi:hypothetical protein NVP1031O_146 [Vibrio phage 1.031.O._10N.261.46.F8]|nr:hypothetical protein NVP1031O_146 [Vibrio phage 1.031.O._10N.261.46.F8]